MATARRRLVVKNEEYAVDRHGGLVTPHSLAFEEARGFHSFRLERRIIARVKSPVRHL